MQMIIIGDTHIHEDADLRLIYDKLAFLLYQYKGLPVITNGDFYDLWYTSYSKQLRNKIIQEIISLCGQYSVMHIPGNHDRQLLQNNIFTRYIKHKGCRILHHIHYIKGLVIGHGHWRDDYNLKYYTIGKWATQQQKMMLQICPKLYNIIERHIINPAQAKTQGNVSINDSANQVCIDKFGETYKFGIFAHTHQVAKSKKWLNVGHFLRHGAWLIDYTHGNKIEYQNINI